jgi:hypothetical protein
MKVKALEMKKKILNATDSSNKKKFQLPMPSVRCPQMTPDIFLGTMVYQTIE